MKQIGPSQLKTFAVFAIPTIAVIGFIADLHTQRGIDDWVWYFVALLLAIFLNKQRLPFSLAAIFSVLTLAGFYLSPPPREEANWATVALVNCLAGIGVLWFTAAMVYLRQKLEFERRTSDERYRFLFENMQSGYAHCRMIFEGNKASDFVYLSVNPAFEKITGLTGVVGRRVTEVFPDIREAQPELFERYGAVASTGAPARFEYYLKASRLWLSVSAYCPAIGEFVTTFENITDRKSAENAALLFRKLMDQSSDGIDVVDPETGRFLDVNETAQRRLGYTREEFLAMCVSDVDVMVKQSSWPHFVRDLRIRRTMFLEGRQKKKDGTTFPVEVSISLVNLDREYITAVVRDISERKAAEEAMHKSQEQIFSLVEQAPVCIAMLDTEMRYIITSRRWAAEYGRGHEVLTGLSHYELNPDMPESWKDVHRRGLAGEFLKNDDDCWAQADGTKIWMRWAVHPWRDERGTIRGIIISTENITDWKKAQEEALKSEDRLRMVTENARVGLVMLNTERRHIFANGTYLQILGLSKNGIVGQTVADVLGPLYEEQVRPKLDLAFAGRRISYELRKPQPEGDRFFAVKYEPMKSQGAVSQVVVVIMEITEQKRAHEEIRNQLDELQRWHGVMLGREKRIFQLKQEVNELLANSGQDLRYAQLTTT